MLPATPPRGNPLIFHEWTPGAAMIAERFGTLRPEGAVLAPDLLLVPLLAFDRQGRRLGYGGGYYDRTLADSPWPRRDRLRFRRAGGRVRAGGPADIRLDAVATERGVIACER